MFAVWLGAILAAAVVAAPQPGDRVPSMSLRTLDGKAYAWHPGQAAVLSFCAFWCDTWKQQIPRVQEARQSLRGLPIEFLNVSVDGRWLDKARGAPGLVLSDEGGRCSNSLDIDRVPYTLIVDREGVVRWASYGIARSADLIREGRAALGARRGGIVYLTFDDFPPKSGGPELLDVLRAERVRATMFCIGDHLGSAAALVRRAAKEGHSLQMHSWAHDAEHPDLARCRAEILRLCGVTPTLYRPPGSESILDASGKPAIHRPVADPYDYTAPPVDELVRRVCLKVKDRGVVQLHAGSSATLEALPRIIANLRGRGYTFGLLR